MTRPASKARSKALQKNFGENLLKARCSLDPPMTQAALARKTGRDRSYISEIETGEVNITIKTATDLAAAVGMTAVELFSSPDEFDRILKEKSAK